MGTNTSPQAGHFIRSKSIRLTSAGVIVRPHFGHTLSRAAITFAMSILLLRGMRIRSSVRVPVGQSLDEFHVGPDGVTELAHQFIMLGLIALRGAVGMSGLSVAHFVRSLRGLLQIVVRDHLLRLLLRAGLA